jgi:hypothetical protein
VRSHPDHQPDRVADLLIQPSLSLGVHNTAATSAVTRATSVTGLAIADYPLQFRYRTGRAEHLLTQLTRTT